MTGEGERERHARSFGGVAEVYERARPDYPREAAAWLVGDAAAVIDLGAGTGKLTRVLVGLGLEVVAVEPSAGMAAILRETASAARVLCGTAEQIPLADGSVDVVVAGQAFHWFDAGRALPEIARVLSPHGRLGLVWNARDVSVPWVERLGELLGHEGWGRSPLEAIAASGRFGPVEQAEFRHEQRLDRQGLLDFVLSRSYVAVQDAGGRTKVLDEVGRFFDETADGGELVLPYVTRCLRTTRL